MEDRLTGKDRAKPDEGADLEQLIEWFEDAEEATDQSRAAAERRRDFYDGNQWTAEEIQTFQDRRQPIVTMNRIGPKINYLLGFETQARTDPRAFPRNPTDEEAAEACTDALRYLHDDLDLDQALSLLWQYMLIEGFGAIELKVDPETGKFEAVGWDWDRLFYDPHSRRADFSDARYLGGVVWMDFQAAVEMWPDAKDVFDTTHDQETSDTYDDRPRWKSWMSGSRRKRVRIVQMYYKRGRDWYWCIYTKGGKIAGGVVPFRDEDGQSWCPFIMQSAMVDRENNRYGLVEWMISPQEEINKRRSKLLHELNTNQVIMEEGAVEDVDLARRELARPDGVVKVVPGMRFDRLDRTKEISGQAQLLSEAKNEIELLGPNAAMQGQQGDSASGRAILASQQGGQTEIAMILDRHRQAKRRVFRGLWSLVRQYWTEEKWVRVTDDEKNVRFVGFNRPVTAAEDLQKQAIESGADPQMVAERLQMFAQDPMRGPALQQVVRMENVPAQMVMDITLEEAPNQANIQEEQFQALANMAPVVTFPPEVYIRSSSLRDKDQLLEIIANASQNPAAAQAAELEAEEKRAKIEKDRASAIKTMAETDALDGQMDGAVAGVPMNGPPGEGMPQQGFQ